MCGASEFVTYTAPSASRAMSLQSAGDPGRATLTLPSPLARSKPLRWLPVVDPGPAIPIKERSLEQTHSNPAFSSTRTPNVERLLKLPGLIHSSERVAPGLMRQIPRSEERRVG